MAHAFVIFILQHPAYFTGQYSLFCIYGLFERERLATLTLYTLHLVLVMRVSPVHGISQQCDQFGIGYDRRSPSGGVRMKQVIRAGLSRDVLIVVRHLQREIGTVPIVAFSVVEIKVVYLLGEGRLHIRMLHQELVQKSSATLLRPDNEKVWQRSHLSSSQSPKMPGKISLFAALRHNSCFLLQVRVHYKPTEDAPSHRIFARIRHVFCPFRVYTGSSGSFILHSRNRDARGQRIGRKEVCCLQWGWSAYYFSPCVTPD